jgi:hypothetical protein
MKMGREDKLLALLVKHLDFEYPSLLYCHVPNEGKRNPLKAKLLGIRAGAPDVLIFEPNGKYVGLAIELKVGKNVLSPAQLGFLEQMRTKRWKTVVCYTIEEAVKELNDYFVY